MRSARSDATRRIVRDVSRRHPRSIRISPSCTTETTRSPVRVNMQLGFASLRVGVAHGALEASAASWSMVPVKACRTRVSFGRECLASCCAVCSWPSLMRRNSQHLCLPAARAVQSWVRCGSRFDTFASFRARRWAGRSDRSGNLFGAARRRHHREPSRGLGDDLPVGLHDVGLLRWTASVGPVTTSGVFVCRALPPMYRDIGNRTRRALTPDRRGRLWTTATIQQPASQSRFASSVIAKSQLAIAEVFDVVVGAAGFVAGHAAQAAVDGLTFEAAAGCLDVGDDVTSGELRSAGALVKLVDGVEEGGPAAWAGIGDPCLQWWDGEGGSVDGFVAVRIV